uniref:Ammonium transporter n=1 Tax=Manihot esculenta TaxID=3983 RepID=D2XSJ3_MANES|nr:AMT2 [Manihot esculenta]
MAGAYDPSLPEVPEWLNKGDNAWQLTAATLVALQSMPGLVILYASIVKKKWAVNSAFMALYAFAAVLLCWVLFCYKMAFGEELLPFWGKGGPAFNQGYLKGQAKIPNSNVAAPWYPMATLVYFQFTFAAITTILVAGSVLGRMNIKAWMAFVPLWLIFSYTVGAYSIWGGGFLYQWGVIDYSGGYVIHLSSGVAGFVAAYWVGPRLKSDRERFPPNNVLLMLAGAGLLWMGWSGFNGGAPYAANLNASIAILNTNISAATSLLVWTSLDVVFFGKPSVIGAVQGMVTGLACVTPGAGLVQSWAAIVMGALSGSIPWVSMMVLHKKSSLLQQVDDTLGVFHTHAVAGLLGGLLTGLLAEPDLCDLILPKKTRGAFYGGNGGRQFLKQLVAACFIIVWNIVSTTIILLAIRLFIPLRMPEEQLVIGDDAVHGEEAYALWGDGEKFDATRHVQQFERDQEAAQSPYVHGARGVTINL